MLTRNRKFLSQSLEQAKQIGNNQIVFICLAFMSHRFFANIVSDQAEKAARAAFFNAKKSQDSLWQSVAGEMLAGNYSQLLGCDSVLTQLLDCLARKGDHEASYTQRKDVHSHQVAVAQNLGQFRQAPQYEPEPAMIDPQSQFYQQMDPHSQYYYGS